MINLIFQPNFRLGAKNPTLFWTSYFPFSCNSVVRCKVLTCKFLIIIISIVKLWIKSPVLDLILYTLATFLVYRVFPILDQNCLISVHYYLGRLNCLKTIPFTAAHSHTAYGSTPRTYLHVYIQPHNCS